MMTFVHAFILGVVEGITEFLPISSTGHLILVGKLLELPSTAFLKSFDITIQLGAILAVVLLYAKRLLVDRALLERVIVAFIPTGLIGFFVYPFVKHVLLGSTSVVAWSLLVGGIIIVLFERSYIPKERGGTDLSLLSYSQAALIGLFQSISIIPGVSRAAATMIGGMALGVSRKAIVEFTFLLAIPTMVVATGYDLLKNANSFSSDQFGLLSVGFVTSFVVALVVIRFLLKFIQTHTFTPFGFYRIAAAIVFWMVK